MPMYSVLCNDCGKKDAVWRRIADRDSLPPCKDCNGSLDRIVDAPMVAPDYTESFISPATGRVISSRAQHQDDLARSGSILNEPGLKQDIQRNREFSREKTFAPMAAVVDKTVSALVAQGKIEN